MPKPSQDANSTPTIKLHAFLAHAGVASRREAERLIEKGQVTVNGVPAKIGQRIDPQRDQVYFRHRLVSQPKTHQSILLNKPLGVVSTVKDELGRQTVLDLIPTALRSGRLYPVGRLDQDSQGLLLLTNDGELAYRLTHPSFKVPKTYQVKLDRPMSDKALAHLQHGVKLSDGFTQPTKVTPLPERGETWFEITLHEGRNRQVRRMYERVGYQVEELIRTTMGPFQLKELDDQRYRVLSPVEVAAARQQLGLSKS